MPAIDLHHLAIKTHDVDATVKFYNGVIGSQSVERPNFDFPGAWYQLGSAQELHLIGERDQPVHAGTRGNHFALMIDDMDVWEAHLQELGVEYYERRTRPDGAFQIYVTDPDGHCIELCTAPGTAS